MPGTVMMLLTQKMDFPAFLTVPYGKILNCSQLHQNTIHFLALGHFLQWHAKYNANLSSKFVDLFQEAKCLVVPSEHIEEASSQPLWEKVARCALWIFVPFLNVFFWWQNSHIRMIKANSFTEVAKSVSQEGNKHLLAMDGLLSHFPKKRQEERIHRFYADLLHTVNRNQSVGKIIEHTEKSLHLELFEAYVFDELEKALWSERERGCFVELFDYLDRDEVPCKIVKSTAEAFEKNWDLNVMDAVGKGVSFDLEEVEDGKAKQQLYTCLEAQRQKLKDASIRSALQKMNEKIFVLDTTNLLEQLVDIWRDFSVPLERIDQAMERWESFVQSDEAVVKWVQKELRDLQKYFEAPLP